MNIVHTQLLSYPIFFHPRQISATIIALVLRAHHFFSVHAWYGAIVLYDDVHTSIVYRLPWMVALCHHTASPLFQSNKIALITHQEE
jgi:hypothetical protein